MGTLFCKPCKNFPDVKIICIQKCVIKFINGFRETKNYAQESTASGYLPGGENLCHFLHSLACTHARKNTSRLGNNPSRYLLCSMTAKVYLHHSACQCRTTNFIWPAIFILSRRIDYHL